ncbi:MAG: hypothetical protein CMJ69_19675 [Planctomycetaceae bacterium]|nr:hypothetical protein [Planctomycetaceae bacterium]
MASHSSFPRGDSGRSRRRLLLIQAAADEEKRARKLARAAQRAADYEQKEQTIGDLTEVQTGEAVGRAVPELIEDGSLVDGNPDRPEDDTPRLRTFDPGGDQHPARKNVLETIHELMAGPRPATWVFCGDGPVETAFPDQFAAELRTTFRRPLDVVVNTLVPDSPLEMLLEHLEWQLARFHPDVVNLVIGSTTSSTGPEFATTLVTLVDQLQALRTAVVLHALAPDDSEQSRKQVDQIRILASEQNIPLVDHSGVHDDRDRIDRFCQTLELQPPVHSD